jgi:hypothetical protein
MFVGGHFGTPGQSEAIFHDVNEIHWGGDNQRLRILNAQAVVSGAARDAANTPTTVLRIGLIMGQITATKKYKQYDPAATDGSQVPVGVLPVELVTVDPISGSNLDKSAPIVIQAPLRASALRILGAAFIGHPAELAVRAAFVRSGNFIFDDDPMGLLSGRISRNSVKAANYTVTAADTGTLFQAKTGAVTFTLPTRKEGLLYQFLQTTNSDMIINGGASHIVAVNTATASSVTFNTTNQKLGARAQFECVNVDGTLKWIYSLLSTGTAGTVA